jgi:16S rRNA (cytidine1402-2'-O)-methyltransferase
MPGTLYIVATPIGNLADWSARAIDTLKQVDLIAAEDTRHSLPLLQHHGISTRCQAYHAHNESEQCAKLLDKLTSGESIALISDAGTPLISDPGSLLVRQAQQADIAVVPIPGACAAITALCASGLNANEFRFIGFLSSKGEKRKRQLQQLVEDSATLILYESVHRIADLMTALTETLPAEREVCLARELTKRFEQIITAPIAELHTWFLDHPENRKGEYVVIVSGAPAKSHNDTELRKTLQLLMAELPLKKAAEITAKLTGERKNSVYELALKLKDTH